MGRAGLRWDAPREVVGAASALVVLVVLGSAWGGSWELEHRDYDFGWLDRPTQEALPESDLEPFDLPEETGSGTDLSWLGPVLGVVVRVVALTVAVVVVAWALRRLWSRFRYRDAPRRRPDPVGGAVAVAVEEPDLPVLRRGVVEARRYLTEIDRPVDAVVAAWLALEDAAGSSGVRRMPAQTPTEFTVAVLERTSADAEATTELLALYHRARFSRQPIGADEVALASRCLARLAASWDAVAVNDAVAR